MATCSYSWTVNIVKCIAVHNSYVHSVAMKVPCGQNAVMVQVDVTSAIIMNNSLMWICTHLYT